MPIERTLRQDPLAFLVALEMAIPPPPNRHHGLHAAQYDMHGIGPENVIALQITFGNWFFPVYFESEDLDREASEIIAEILETIRQRQFLVSL